MRASWSVSLVMIVAGTALADEPVFERIDLVSDIQMHDTTKDENLVNPWGLASSPSGPWAVANNGSNTATMYDAKGNRQSPRLSVPGSPTGEVYNGGTGFVVINMRGKGGPAIFIWAGEDGTVSGWNPSAAMNSAIVMYDGSDEGDVYKGLAIATDHRGRTRLFITDFHNARIVVLDDEFNEVELGKHAFVDHALPCGYAPFGIHAFGRRLFVTYALQDADKHDDVAGPGHGFVDEYDLEGHFVRRVASRGALNSPWGLAIGPESFGRFDDTLLVGNFGDGRIHSYRETPWGSFRFEGALRDEHHHAIHVDGLWSIVPGNDGVAGSSRDLYFTAGINDEQDGLFGLIHRERW